MDIVSIAQTRDQHQHPLVVSKKFVMPLPPGNWNLTNYNWLWCSEFLLFVFQSQCLFLELYKLMHNISVNLLFCPSTVFQFDKLSVHFFIIICKAWIWLVDSYHHNLKLWTENGVKPLFFLQILDSNWLKRLFKHVVNDTWLLYSAYLNFVLLAPNFASEQFLLP